MEKSSILMRSPTREFGVQAIQNLLLLEMRPKEEGQRGRTYSFRDCSLVVQILAQATDNLKLFLDSQTINGGLDDVPNTGLVHGNEAVVVHVGEESHDELAVHTVRNTTVARDRFAEVLDLESALKSGSEESTERRDQGGEGCENQNVELNGLDVERGTNTGPVGNSVWLGHKGRVGCALQSSQNVRTEIIDRANKVLVAHEDVGHEVTETNGAEPGAQEPFNRLLRRQLDQLSAAESDTADIGEDIVCNHQGRGQEEPNHALQDIVHDKVRLHDDQVERHVRPGPLGELEAVVALLQGCDEEDET